jgi:hypothetical protein
VFARAHEEQCAGFERRVQHQQTEREEHVFLERAQGAGAQRGRAKEPCRKIKGEGALVCVTT